MKSGENVAQAIGIVGGEVKGWRCQSSSTPSQGVVLADFAQVLKRFSRTWGMAIFHDRANHSSVSSPRGPFGVVFAQLGQFGVVQGLEGRLAEPPVEGDCRSCAARRTRAGRELVTAVG